MFTFPALLIGFLWLGVLGWGMHALLRRHIRLDDELAEQACRLTGERHARSQAERDLANTRRTLGQLAREHEAVREAERRRIGRDIHDDLGQQLLALKIDLSLLHVSTTGAHPQITRQLGAMLARLDLTIGCLRTVINDLRPPALEAGLAAALAWQLEEFSRMHGIAHRLHVDPACTATPDAARDAAVFRILQESLSNVVRHAHASEVRVRLARCDKMLTLTVHDNGVGMPASVRGCGNGIAGIRERVACIGGQFSIASQAGSGTLLTLSFPLAPPCLMR